MDFINQVLLGNCLHVLRQIPDEVYDACVTDVPYGLGKKEPSIEEIIAYLQGADLDTGGDFMGKDWQIPSVLVWREVYRVLKPGAHVFSFGGTRTWDLISVGLRAAGFHSRDTIKGNLPGLAWIQGQGMPKGANLKPMWEPIAVFRKPFKGSATRNVERYGTGKLQIEASRVKHANEADFAEHKAQVDAIKAKGGVRGNSWKNSSDLSGANDVKREGRWPPNVVMVHTPVCVKSPTDETWTCGPGCPVQFLDEQSGDRPSMLTGRADPNVSHRHPGTNASSKSAFLGERSHLSTAYADSGGASRFYPQFESDPDPFFYTGKATQRETTLDGEIENDHPCLHPDAEVLTDRGYRSIAEVGVGTRVYTADGSFSPVVAVTRHKYTSPDLFRICVRGGWADKSTLASDNHPFLIWRPTRVRKSVTGGSVQWLRADEVEKGDYTMTPVLTESKGTSSESLDFWFLFGLYLAEGHTQKAGHGDNIYVRYSLHKKEEHLVERIRRFFGKVSVYPNGENGIQVMVFDSSKSAHMKALGGSGAGAKFVAPSVWFLPRAAQTAIFEGWAAGDGGLVRGGVQGKTVSRDLAAQLQLLGEVATGQTSRVQRSEYPEGAGIGDRSFQSMQACYQLNFSGSGTNGPKRVVHAGVEYSLRYVTSVERVPYEGDVVNLSVEGSPTFQTVVGMSHNTKKPLALMRYLCRLAAQKGSLILDPFCGSGSTLHAAILERMRFTGIELNPGSHKTASDRVRIVLEQTREQRGQQELFEAMQSLSDE